MKTPIKTVQPRRFRQLKAFDNKERLKILFLIPHPFYQDRGSPIADNMILKALSTRGDRIDVVTYSEGKDISYKEVNIYRIIKVPFLLNIRPGFSWKKLVCDLLMFFEVIRLISKKRYDLVHAVEETVFIALFLKKVFKLEYIYDMDSSLAQQMIEKHSWLSPLKSTLRFFERIAIKNAKCVIPVCQALADDISMYRPKKVEILPDISLLAQEEQPIVNLRDELAIDNLILMYVGNLENYQGVDLLLESFAIVLGKANADLVIVGGEPSHIRKYQKRARVLDISNKVHFLGAKPAGELGSYLAQADILLSPRIQGKNTPMKIYSYLDSGKPVVATNLLTHTQVLSSQVAMLATPTPADFAEATLSLMHNQTLRLSLGRAGKSLIQQKYTYTAFYQKLNSLYDWLKIEILSAKVRNFT